MKANLTGLAFILFGCFMVWRSYKHPIRRKDGSDYFAATKSGYVSGIIFILLGLAILLGFYGDLAPLFK